MVLLYLYLMDWIIPAQEREMAGCFENGDKFSYSLEFIKSLG
jgi:hypothetical protein